MADGELTLQLDEETAERLKVAAAAVGSTVEDYARDLIARRLEAEDDWAEDERILQEMDRTNVSYSVAEGMAAFDGAMKTYLANKR
jgi:plasmid stability protein